MSKFFCIITFSVMWTISCQSNDENLILLGKWSVLNIQMDFPKSHANLAHTLINHELENTKSKITFHFLPNHQYELHIGNLKESGSFTYLSDSLLLVLQKQNNPHKHPLKIHQVSTTKLEFAYYSANGSISRWTLSKQPS